MREGVDIVLSKKEIKEQFGLYSECCVILWGCGILGEQFLRFAQKMDIEIFACCDNNKEKWGTTFFDIPVISPSALEAMEKESRDSHPSRKILVQIALSRDYMPSVVKQLEEMGIFSCVEVIDRFQDFRDIILDKFMEKYPDITKNNIVSLNPEGVDLIKKPEIPEIPEFADEEFVVICQPAKTADTAIKKTCEKYNVSCLFSKHDAYSMKHNQKKIKVTTAIREPISRLVSDLYQGLASGAICSVAEVSFEDYADFIMTGDAQPIFDQRFYKKGLKSTPTFQHFFNGFSQVVVDVLQFDFSKEKGYTIIKEGNYDIFFYQLEKLDSLVPELSEWLGVPFDHLEKANEASKKWVSDSYKRAKKEVTFSQRFFDDCYNDPYVQHCYSQEDIAKFKARWRGQIDPNK